MIQGKRHSRFCQNISPHANVIRFLQQIRSPNQINNKRRTNINQSIECSIDTRYILRTLVLVHFRYELERIRQIY